MKAIEAAKLANVIISDVGTVVVKNNIGHWIHAKSGLLAPLETYERDYIPLVPLKTYEVGQQVKFWEAVDSKLPFQISPYDNIFKALGDKIYEWNNQAWDETKMWYGNLFDQVFRLCRIVDEPKSINIEDLAFGTHFKARLSSGGRKEVEFVKGSNKVWSTNDIAYEIEEMSNMLLTEIKTADGWIKV